MLDVLEGPVCDHEGHVWWRVQRDNLVGWTPEGQDGSYYIEPVSDAG